VLEPYEADLRRLVEATPDRTLVELQAELQRRCGVRAGLSTIHNALRRLGLRHKKSP
jgi:transposase